MEPGNNGRASIGKRLAIIFVATIAVAILCGMAGAALLGDGWGGRCAQVVSTAGGMMMAFVWVQLLATRKSLPDSSKQ